MKTSRHQLLARIAPALNKALILKTAMPNQVSVVVVGKVKVAVRVAGGLL